MRLFPQVRWAVDFPNPFSSVNECYFVKKLYIPSTSYHKTNIGNQAKLAICKKRKVRINGRLDLVNPKINKDSLVFPKNTV